MRSAKGMLPDVSGSSNMRAWNPSRADFLLFDGSSNLEQGQLPFAGRRPGRTLLVIPRSGHTVTSEEPAAFNAALAELFAAAEAGRWMSHRPPS